MRLLVIDDEPLARTVLVQMCRADPTLEVVGEAGSGVAAIDATDKLRPDLMLLDVELPDMNGFAVLEASRGQRAPLAIMVTAHAEHAVDAFAAGVVDYLLKPVSHARLVRSLARARARFELTPARTGGAPGHEQPPRFLIGEKERRLYPLEPKSIHYVESDGNYVTYRTATAEYLSRDSIKRLAALLATAGFVRIERSLLLNVHAVAFAVPAGHGSFAFTLTSGTVLQSSATYRDNILRMLPFVRTTQTEVTWSPAAEHCSVPLS